MKHCSKGSSGVWMQSSHTPPPTFNDHMESYDEPSWRCIRVR